MTIMAIKPSVEDVLRPYVSLDDELLAYLSDVEEAGVLQKIASLDSYADYRLTASECVQLSDELNTMEAKIEARELAVPPEYVGLEGSDDPAWGEEFGWGGLLGFVGKLGAVLDEGRRLNGYVMVIGD